MELHNIACYTISMDLPFAQLRWYQAKEVENVKILSDYKDRIFGKVTGTYIKELRLLTRAALVLDCEYKLVYADYLDEISN